MIPELVIIISEIIGATRLVLNPFHLTIMLIIISNNLNKNNVKFLNGILNIAVFQLIFNASMMLRIYIGRSNPLNLLQTIIFIFISLIILLYCFQLLKIIKWIKFIIIPDVDFNSLKSIVLLTILFIVSIIPMRLDMADAFVSLSVGLIQRNLIYLLLVFLLLPITYCIMWFVLKSILKFIKKIIERTNKSDLFQKIVASFTGLIILFLISAKIIGLNIDWW